MNPKQFLQIGGIVLVAVGILGFVGILGPDAESSVFGPNWWFDSAENWAHLFLGIVALIVAYVFPATTHKTITIIVGVVGILVGLYSITGETQLLGANLESPLDTILHLAIGAWALWASYKK